MARTVPENMDTEDVDVIVIDSDSDCVIVNDSDIEQEQKKLWCVFHIINLLRQSCKKLARSDYITKTMLSKY